MAPDSYTETTRQGFGSRIVESIKGVLIGFVFFLLSFVVLWWNEGKLAGDKVAYSQMAKEVIEGDVTKNDPSNNGKLLHLTGQLTSTEEVGDDSFLAPGPYLILQRDVEMYQWTESEQSSTKENLGGSQETTTTYTYNLEWKSGRVDSSNFKKAAEHVNPELRVEGATFKSSATSFGAYDGTSVLDQLSASDELRLTDQIVLEDAGTLEGKYIMLRVNPSSKTPQLGDIRVSFKVLKPGEFSVIARQGSNGELENFVASNQTEKYLVQSGKVSAEAMLRAAESESSMLAWILRVVGFLMMWMGLGLMLKPFPTLLAVVPFLGSIGGAAIGIITFVVALVLSVATSLVAFIAHSFWAMVGVAVVMLAAFLFWLKRRSAAVPVSTSAPKTV